ncbi:MAG: rhomboid family intramembrane serine protease [Bacteroidia bacterium]|nr:rhomboid family intramembrane serine protease [Bacteroidia bacterium]MBT8269558.1 rhomboid family intramembrane serine protease [Bacteroidia bacterium]NNF81617.1 rhomboid family intramembrane serine protease [Flavobacteriaceae bacterium]NNK71137.1 rhomboid family intramembrane serine protease [Flavobacteriaceae bacterium]NNL79418.1 rhomboid family intramembrane serine protease [Flavobacteriaceae bacterium]
MKQEPFKFSTGVVGFPLLFVLIIWIVFWAEVRFGFRLNDWGIYPRTFTGLRGIVFSPFIHSDMEHLYHNSIPLLVLSTAVFYFYHKISWRIIILGILLSGLLTWFIGRPANHIGASGLIYVLMSFTLFKGIFSRHFRLIALSFLVIFLYGSMIWYVFPVKEQMSWEGHLSGLIVGFVFALYFRKSIAKPWKYEWESDDYKEEDDPFLKHFDENGNFIENPDPVEPEEEPKPRITYIFRPKRED